MIQAALPCGDHDDGMARDGVTIGRLHRQREVEDGKRSGRGGARDFLYVNTRLEAPR